MSVDFKYIVWWWLIIFLFSGLTLPLVVSIFRKFWDRGYAFSKILSLGLITYITFIYGVFKLLPFTNQTIFFSCLLLVAFDVYYLSRNGNFNIFKTVLLKHNKSFIAEEILFFIVLTAWSFVRGYAPDIEGLEKFMDWGFVNSALRSEYLPPKDMWFAGEYINYYYFGHLIFALITKVSSIPSAITYNLSIATAAALTFISGFSLASNLAFNWIQKQKNNHKFGVKHVIVTGLVSALLLTFGGNLHAVYKIAKINIQQEGHLVLTKDAILKASQTYWYPDATRFIGYDPDIQDKTIHEFPIYSFVVADLHGHMNDIPVVIFIMAYLFSFVLSAKVNINPLTPSWPLIIPLSLGLSIAFMSNAWDFAVYGLLFAWVYFLYYFIRKDFWYSLASTVLNGVLVLLFLVSVYSAIHIKFRPYGRRHKSC